MTAGRITASRAHVSTTMDTKAVKAGVRQIERELSTLSKSGRSLATLGAQIRGLGEGVNRFGRRLTFAGLAASAPFAIAIKQAGDFEKAISSIKINIGDKFAKDLSVMDKATFLSLNTVGKQAKFAREQYKDLGRTVRQIAKQFPKNPLEVAGTANTLARAGLSRTIIQGQAPRKGVENDPLAGKGGLLKPFVQLAVADTTGADIAEVTEKGLSLLKAFDLLKRQAGELNEQHVAERITRDMATLLKATTNANVSVVSLAESMKFTGGVFAKSIKADGTGNAFREVIAVTSILQERLGDASIAGTALRGMMLRLQTPPRKVAEALAKVGFDAKTMTDSTGQAQLGLVALLRTIEQMRSKVGSGGLSEIEFQQFLGGIFENRQITAALSLVDEGAEEIAKRVENIRIKGDPQGFFDDFTTEFTNNIPGAADRMKSSLQDLAIEIGSAVSPQVQGALELLGDFAGKIKKITEENPKLVRQMVLLTGAITALGGAVAITGGLLSTMSLPIIALGIASAGLGRFIDGISKPFNAIKTLAGGIAAPFRDAAAAMRSLSKSSSGFEAVKKDVESFTRTLVSLPIVQRPGPNFFVERMRQNREAAEKMARAAREAAVAQEILQSGGFSARPQKRVAGYIEGPRAKTPKQLKEDERAFHRRKREKAEAERKRQRRRRGVRPMGKRRRGGELAVFTGPTATARILQAAFLSLARAAAVLDAEFTSTFTRVEGFTRPAPRRSDEVKETLRNRDFDVLRRKKAAVAAAGAAAGIVAGKSVPSSGLTGGALIRQTPEQILLAALKNARPDAEIDDAVRKVIQANGAAAALADLPDLTIGFNDGKYRTVGFDAVRTYRETSRTVNEMMIEMLRQSRAARDSMLDELAASVRAANYVLPSGQYTKTDGGLDVPKGAVRSAGISPVAALLQNLIPVSAVNQLRKVDLNIDSLANVTKELEAVVGKGKSSKIANAIGKNGPLRTLDDLVRIVGIGERTVDKIKKSGRFSTHQISKGGVFNPVAGLLEDQRVPGGFEVTGGSTGRVRPHTLDDILLAMFPSMTRRIEDQSGNFNQLPSVISRDFVIDGQVVSRGPGGDRSMSNDVPLIAATPGNRQGVFQGERNPPKPVREASPRRLLGLPAPVGFGDFFSGQGEDRKRRSGRGLNAAVRRKGRHLRHRVSEYFTEPSFSKGEDEYGAYNRRTRRLKKPEFQKKIGELGKIGGKGLAKVGATGMKGLFDTIVGLTSKIGTAILAFTLFGAKIAAITAVVAALLLQGNLLGNVFDAVGKSLSGTFKAIGGQIETASKLLASFKFKAIGDEVETVGKKINTFTASLQDGLIIVLGNFAKEIPGLLFSVGKAVITSIGEMIRSMFASIYNFIAGGSSSGGIVEGLTSAIDKVIADAELRQVGRRQTADARIAAGTKEEEERLVRITGFEAPDIGREAFEEMRKATLDLVKSNEIGVAEAESRLSEGYNRVQIDELQAAADDMAEGLKTAGDKFRETLKTIRDMSKFGVINEEQEKQFTTAAKAEFIKDDPFQQAMKRVAEEQKRAADAIASAAKSLKEDLFPKIKLENDLKDISKLFAHGQLTGEEYSRAIVVATRRANEDQARIDEEEDSRSGQFGGSVGSTTGFFARNSSLFGASIDDENKKLLNQNLKASTGLFEAIKERLVDLNPTNTLKAVAGDLSGVFSTLGTAARDAATTLLGIDKIKPDGLVAGVDKAGASIGGLLGRGLTSVLGKVGSKQSEDAGQVKEEVKGTGFGFLGDILNEVKRGGFSDQTFAFTADTLRRQGFGDEADKLDADLQKRNEGIPRAADIEKRLKSELDELAVASNRLGIAFGKVLDQIAPARFSGPSTAPSRVGPQRGGYIGSAGVGAPGPIVVDGARASGGPAKKGGTYLVGEKGPELFVPDSTGEVIPNDLTEKLFQVDGAFAEGTSGAKKKFKDLNAQFHSTASSSPRSQLIDLVVEQHKQFRPDDLAGQMLLERRNLGRSLSPYSEMKKHGTKLGPERAFAHAGAGRAYVPENIKGQGRTMQGMGRPAVANHEFEHAFAQTAKTVDRELKAAMGDIAFTIKNFHLQEGKQLQGNVSLSGSKGHSARFIEEMSGKHGYFSGQSMTSLLESSTGQSYMKQLKDGFGGMPSEEIPGESVRKMFAEAKQTAEALKLPDPTKEWRVFDEEPASRDLPSAMGRAGSIASISMADVPSPVVQPSEVKLASFRKTSAGEGSQRPAVSSNRQDRPKLDSLSPPPSSAVPEVPPQAVAGSGSSGIIDSLKKKRKEIAASFSEFMRPARQARAGVAASSRSSATSGYEDYEPKRPGNPVGNSLKFLRGSIGRKAFGEGQESLNEQMMSKLQLQSSVSKLDDARKAAAARRAMPSNIGLPPEARYKFADAPSEDNDQFRFMSSGGRFTFPNYATDEAKSFADRAASIRTDTTFEERMANATKAEGYPWPGYAMGAEPEGMPGPEIFSRESISSALKLMDKSPAPSEAMRERRDGKMQLKDKTPTPAEAMRERRDGKMQLKDKEPKRFTSLIEKGNQVSADMSSELAENGPAKGPMTDFSISGTGSGTGMYVGKPRTKEEMDAAVKLKSPRRQNTNASRMKARLGPVADGKQNTAANRFDFRSRAKTGLSPDIQNTAANRFDLRSRAKTGLPSEDAEGNRIQNTAANRFDHRSRSMTGLSPDVQNTAENRRKARMEAMRKVQQDAAVSMPSFNPNFQSDAARAGANAGGTIKKNDLEPLAKDATIKDLIGAVHKLITEINPSMS